ncbi:MULTISPECIES: rhodanese-like domain-containing protein [Dyadobacter]|uniref:Rhodanese-like domain-containing protein n=1 Tax=Dyadobacter psychrotolerans TaxID=2541721 RepID=A0A4R5DQL6_9BACT|nr:rhodanese-like domain-containing protein [Dyadobacter psychrotolerans]TDE13305.1 rhodanese-like domain-containing protein [Dyadobacter psychrotolerans]
MVLRKTSSIILGFLFMALSWMTTLAQTTAEPWTDSELKPTKELADQINASGKKKPLIINVGPQAVIPGSLDAGPGSEKDNIKKLEKILSAQDKNREVVIYCGCCPFAKCPNVRPAFKVVKEQGFTQARLLNIPKNIKTDWIDKNYPVQ